MKHKKLFITLTAVFSVVIFFAIFIMIWFFGDTYEDFELFRKETEIPGLADGAVPQGIATCSANYSVYNEAEDKTETKSQQYYFVSAYMVDGSASRIYVTGEQTGYVGYVTLKGENGKDFFGHCGGIAINNFESTTTPSTSNAKNYTLWVTGESMVYCAKASDDFVKDKKSIALEIIEKAGRSPDGATADADIPEDYKSIQFTASFNANCNASFCFYYDDPSLGGISYDRLYVGEFYREENYKTDEKRKLTTPNGYTNHAFMYEYNVTTSSNKYGLYTLATSDGIKESDLVPKIQKVYSLPEKIQGIAFSGRTKYSTNDGMLVLSQSYGLANSHLLCFDYQSVINSRQKYTDVTGESFRYTEVYKTFGDGENAQRVPYTDPSLYIYYVDKNDEKMFVNDYSIPSMSEGMCVVTPNSSGNGPVSRVYVLFESAGKKYKTFVRQQVKNVYSFIPKAKK